MVKLRIDDTEIEVDEGATILEAARKAETTGDMEEAILIYRDVIKISQELKDNQTCDKYKLKLEEIEKNG